MATYYVRRDSLGDVTDADAERFARVLGEEINHNVEWGDHSGCDCDDRDDHRYAARRVFDVGAWWYR